MEHHFDQGKQRPRQRRLRALALLGAVGVWAWASPGCDPGPRPTPAAIQPSGAPSAGLGEPGDSPTLGAPAAAPERRPVDPAEAPRIAALRLDTGALATDLKERGEVLRRQDLAVPEGAAPLADALLLTRLRTRLMKDPDIPWMLLQDIESSDGSLTLRGRVATLEQLQRVLLVALSLPEVREVRSLIAVEPDDGAGLTKESAAADE